MTPQEIKRLRESLGRTQEGMGQIVGVSTSTIARWENGETSPLPVFIKKLEGLHKFVAGELRK